MSTYLQLCQDVARECGVGGGADASPKPTTVSSQSGELNRIVNWVRQAYNDIQLSADFRWLRREFTISTVDGTSSYDYTDADDSTDATTISRFDSWYVEDNFNPPTIYLTSSGVGSQSFLSYIPWDVFRPTYLIGNIQSQTSQPVHVTITPDNKLQFGPVPNDAYTVTGEYIRSPQTLTNDSDEPEMPSQYHQLIVYRAMLFYGLFESAPEVISRARIGIRQYTNQLQKNQKSRYRLAGPMA